MTLTTLSCFMFALITATHSLTCHTCDDPSDPACNNPTTRTCGEKDTLCYTLKYKMLADEMVVKGCADNCEKMKQGRMVSTLEEYCCGSDLCNKDDTPSSTDEKFSSKIFTAATEKVSSATETASEGVAEPATKKKPKEVLVEVKPRNGSQLLSVKVLLLILTCCLQLVVYII